MGYENNPKYDAYRAIDYCKKINAKDCCVLPGFIDSHTHPVWEGDRVHEFQMKVYFQFLAFFSGVNFDLF